MEIRLDDEERKEKILQPKYVMLRTPGGEKREFEVVGVVPVGNRAFMIAKFKDGKKVNGKEAHFCFELSSKNGRNNFLLVTDTATIAAVNNEFNAMLKRMDDKGLIPEDK